MTFQCKIQTGKISFCKNWRGITLLSITSNVFIRFDPKYNIYTPRPDYTQRTCRIQERNIVRRTHIHPNTDYRTMPGMETPCYVNFIDFEKAFDSIHRRASQTQRTIHRRRNRVHIPGSQIDKRWKHTGWNQDKDQQGKWSICGSDEHLEHENNQQEIKDTYFQGQHTKRIALCCRVLESDQRNMPHPGSIPKQVP